MVENAKERKARLDKILRDSARRARELNELDEKLSDEDKEKRQAAKYGRRADIEKRNRRALADRKEINK